MEGTGGAVADNKSDRSVELENEMMEQIFEKKTEAEL